MKRDYVLTITVILILFALNSLAQTGIEKKIITTLVPGETLANGENCFLFDRNPESMSFLTVVGSGSSKQYFCYGKDGKKTGPVQKPDESYWLECKDIDIEGGLHFPLRHVGQQ